MSQFILHELRHEKSWKTVFFNTESTTLWLPQPALHAEQYGTDRAVWRVGMFSLVVTFSGIAEWFLAQH